MPREARLIRGLFCFLSLLVAAGCTSSPPPIIATTVSATPPRDWQQTFQDVQSGVVRISSQGCEKGSSGSGFLIGEDLVVTAAHVVDDSASIGVRSATAADDDPDLDAVILGIAPDSDVALLRISEPVDGHTFVVSKSEPELAEEVAALGFPLGLSLTFNQGRISGLDRSVNTGTFDGQGFIQTDASINAGNSGGPLIDINGDVLGVVSAKTEWTDETKDRPVEGTAFATPADRAFDLVDGWVSKGTEIPMISCDGAEPESSINVQIISDDPEAPRLAQALVAHGTAINNGDYNTAYDVFTLEMQQKVGNVDLWGQALRSSYWRDVTIRDVSVEDEGRRATATVALRTEQDSIDGWEGQTCSDREMEYGFILDGTWHIDSATRIGDPVQCAAPPPETSQPPSPSPSSGDAQNIRFLTPSGNIECMIVVDDSASCQISEHTWIAPPAPADCQGDWENNLLVGIDGAGSFECTGEELTNNNVKAYGSTVSLGSFSCQIERRGVTCANRATEHGFFVSRTQYRLF